jgi:two-component system sensor histidine kinase UhpB
MASPKILVVEDDPAVSDLIAVYLKRRGYEVAGCATSGEEALMLAGRSQPDLALMDISLQGAMDGVQAAERLNSRYNIPVVFLTGLADDATIQRSRVARAFGYVLKPFRADDLKTSIDLALSKHQVESKLRRIERWFTAAIRSIGDAVVTTDERSNVTFLNPVAETLAGWKLDDALGRPLQQIFRIRREDGREQATPLDVPGTDATLLEPVRQAVLIAADAAEIAIEFSSAPVRNDDGAVIGRVFVFRDITARRRSEAEVQTSREQLRALAAHLQSVREEERKRIAREVHDELGQMLTGLKMDLAWLEKRLPGIADPAVRQPLEGKARSMFDLLAEMVKTVRRISAELRPGILDDLGLVSAMEWQAREWEARTGIKCVVTSTLNETAVSPDQGTALFRIFQETLTNVARHADASHVTARLGLDGGWLKLEIQDDGRGITDGEQRRAKSFGLLGMKERATLLGGDFVIQGAPGKGTTVSVRVPLQEKSSP